MRRESLLPIHVRTNVWCWYSNLDTGTGTVATALSGSPEILPRSVAVERASGPDVSFAPTER